MTKPEISESELHAWLDDELTEERRNAVEAFVAAHPDAARRLETYRRNDRALREHFESVLNEPVPPRLATPQRWKSRRLVRHAAVVGWLAIGGFAGWHLHGSLTETRTDTPSWTRRAAVAHVVYTPEVRHPVEVPADQEAHLAAWLSKRLGTTLKVPRLDAQGFSLVGGRLLPGDQGPVAQFMYQDARGQRLTLYIRTDMEQNRETAFRFAEEGSLRQFYWIDRGLGYALSGEIGKDDLLRVANAIYQHLNP
jgi:anti-sigma factor RsiW